MMQYYFSKKQRLILVLSGVFIFFSQIVATATIEKPIVVVTCMYNNEQWVLHNLNSIFMQEYNNFRIIIVDDGSEDKTAEIIRDYIAKNNLSDRITFIANKGRKRKMANLYHVLYLCADTEIVLMLDGDDWFAHEKVFKQINAIYTNEDVWLTYGQYYNVPPEEAIKWGFSPKGYATAMPKEQQDRHEYRSGPFRFMHLRTFYGWLFKVVKLQDLLSETVVGFKGLPFPASNDMAMYYPMIETAHYRIRFVSEIVYIRNLFSEIVGFKVDRKIQRAAAQEIRKKTHYPIAKEPIYRDLEQYLSLPIAAIMLCDKNTERVEKFFESVTDLKRDLVQWYLVCHSSIDKNLIDRLEKRYGVKTVCFHYNDEKSLVIILRQLLNQLTVKHILFMTPEYQKNSLLDCQKAAYWLEKTYARSFHTALQSDLLPMQSWVVPLDDSIYGWKIGCANGAWRLLNPFNGVLYRIDDVKEFLVGKIIKNVTQLTSLFKTEINSDQSAINLCYY
jgi:glycosyltransferase involved in cell wall biosynthesis